MYLLERPTLHPVYFNSIHAHRTYDLNAKTSARYYGAVYRVFIDTSIFLAPEYGARP